MLKELLKKIASELATEKIPYMIGGGQAVLIYGEPRLTKDIDITLGVDIDAVDKIIKIADVLSLKILTPDAKKFVKKTYVLPALDQCSNIRVDFIFSSSSYEKQAIKRAKEIKINNVIVKFVAVEDLIIHKLIAGRARDIEDIKTILLKRPPLNERYLFNVLKIFTVSLDKNLIMEFQGIKRELKIFKKKKS